MVCYTLSMEMQEPAPLPDYKTWPAEELRELTALTAHVQILKGRLLGKTLEKVLILHPKLGNTPIWGRWRKSLHVSGGTLPFVLQFSGESLALWLNDDRHDEHNVKFGHCEALTEKYPGYSLKDFSRFFRDGVIGSRLKDIQIRTSSTFPCLDRLERYRHCPAGYYEKETPEEIIFIFENGQRLIVAERTVAERRSAEPRFKSTDCRIIVGQPPFRRDGTYLSFEGGNTIDAKHHWRPLNEENAILAWADDLGSFFAVMPLEFPEFDEYEYFVIKKDVWLKVLADWKLICEASDFSEVEGLFKSKAAAYKESNKKNSERILWTINNYGKTLWADRDKDRPMYENFKVWLEEQFKTHDCITVRGY